MISGGGTKIPYAEWCVQKKKKKRKKERNVYFVGQISSCSRKLDKLERKDILEVESGKNEELASLDSALLLKMLSSKPGACHQTECLQAREAGRHCH